MMKPAERILDLLEELKTLETAFNQMGGALYSNICADEMNTIMEYLKKRYNVQVKYYQWMPGRVEFTNIDELIENTKKLLETK